MAGKSVSDYLDKATKAIREEEDFKKLLNDRSGPDALRPSQAFVDLHVGKPRTEAKLEAAIKQRADKAMRADNEPASDYVEASPRAKALAEAAERRTSKTPERER